MTHIMIKKPKFGSNFKKKRVSFNLPFNYYTKKRVWDEYGVSIKDCSVIVSNVNITEPREAIRDLSAPNRYENVENKCSVSTDKDNLNNKFESNINVAEPRKAIQDLSAPENVENICRLSADKEHLNPKFKGKINIAEPRKNWKDFLTAKSNDPVKNNDNRNTDEKQFNPVSKFQIKMIQPSAYLNSKDVAQDIDTIDVTPDENINKSDTCLNVKSKQLTPKRIDNSQSKLYTNKTCNEFVSTAQKLKDISLNKEPIKRSNKEEILKNTTNLLNAAVVCKKGDFNTKNGKEQVKKTGKNIADENDRNINGDSINIERRRKFSDHKIGIDSKKVRMVKFADSIENPSIGKSTYEDVLDTKKRKEQVTKIGKKITDDNKNLNQRLNLSDHKLKDSKTVRMEKSDNSIEGTTFGKPIDEYVVDRIQQFHPRNEELLKPSRNASNISNMIETECINSKLPSDMELNSSEKTCNETNVKHHNVNSGSVESTLADNGIEKAPSSGDYNINPRSKLSLRTTVKLTKYPGLEHVSSSHPITIINNTYCLGQYANSRKMMFRIKEQPRVRTLFEGFNSGKSKWECKSNRVNLTGKEVMDTDIKLALTREKNCSKDDENLRSISTNSSKIDILRQYQHDVNKSNSDSIKRTNKLVVGGKDDLRNQTLNSKPEDKNIHNFSTNSKRTKSISKGNENLKNVPNFGELINKRDNKENSVNSRRPLNQIQKRTSDSKKKVTEVDDVDISRNAPPSPLKTLNQIHKMNSDNKKKATEVDDVGISVNSEPSPLNKTLNQIHKMTSHKKKATEINDVRISRNVQPSCFGKTVDQIQHKKEVMKEKDDEALSYDKSKSSKNLSSPTSHLPDETLKRERISSCTNIPDKKYNIMSLLSQLSLMDVVPAEKWIQPYLRSNSHVFKVNDDLEDQSINIGKNFGSKMENSSQIVKGSFNYSDVNQTPQKRENTCVFFKGSKIIKFEKKSDIASKPLNDNLSKDTPTNLSESLTTEGKLRNKNSNTRSALMGNKEPNIDANVTSDPLGNDINNIDVDITNDLIGNKIPKIDANITRVLKDMKNKTKKTKKLKETKGKLKVRTTKTENKSKVGSSDVKLRRLNFKRAFKRVTLRADTKKVVKNCKNLMIKSEKNPKVNEKVLKSLSNVHSNVSWANANKEGTNSVSNVINGVEKAPKWKSSLGRKSASELCKTSKLFDGKRYIKHLKNTQKGLKSKTHLRGGKFFPIKKQYSKPKIMDDSLNSSNISDKVLNKSLNSHDLQEEQRSEVSENFVCHKDASTKIHPQVRSLQNPLAEVSFSKLKKNESLEGTKQIARPARPASCRLNLYQARKLRRNKKLVHSEGRRYKNTNLNRSTIQKCSKAFKNFDLSDENNLNKTYEMIECRDNLGSTDSNNLSKDLVTNEDNFYLKYLGHDSILGSKHTSFGSKDLMGHDAIVGSKYPVLKLRKLTLGSNISSVKVSTVEPQSFKRIKDRRHSCNECQFVDKRKGNKDRKFSGPENTKEDRCHSCNESQFVDKRKGNEDRKFSGPENTKEDRRHSCNESRFLDNKKGNCDRKFSGPENAEEDCFEGFDENEERTRRLLIDERVDIVKRDFSGFEPIENQNDRKVWDKIKAYSDESNMLRLGFGNANEGYEMNKEEKVNFLSKKRKRDWMKGNKENVKDTKLFKYSDNFKSHIRKNVVDEDKEKLGYFDEKYISKRTGELLEVKSKDNESAEEEKLGYFGRKYPSKQTGELLEVKSVEYSDNRDNELAEERIAEHSEEKTEFLVENRREIFESQSRESSREEWIESSKHSEEGVEFFKCSEEGVGSFRRSGGVESFKHSQECVESSEHSEEGVESFKHSQECVKSSEHSEEGVGSFEHSQDSVESFADSENKAEMSLKEFQDSSKESALDLIEEEQIRGESTECFEPQTVECSREPASRCSIDKENIEKKARKFLGGQTTGKFRQYVDKNLEEFVERFEVGERVTEMNTSKYCGRRIDGDYVEKLNKVKYEGSKVDKVYKDILGSPFKRRKEEDCVEKVMEGSYEWNSKKKISEEIPASQNNSSRRRNDEDYVEKVMEGSYEWNSKRKISEEIPASQDKSSRGRNDEDCVEKVMEGSYEWNSKRKISEEISASQDKSSRGRNDEDCVEKVMEGSYEWNSKRKISEEISASQDKSSRGRNDEDCVEKVMEGSYEWNNKRKISEEIPASQNNSSRRRNDEDCVEKLTKGSFERISKRKISKDVPESPCKFIWESYLKDDLEGGILYSEILGRELFGELDVSINFKNRSEREGMKGGKVSESIDNLVLRLEAEDEEVMSIEEAKDQCIEERVPDLLSQPGRECTERGNIDESTDNLVLRLEAEDEEIKAIEDIKDQSFEKRVPNLLSRSGRECMERGNISNNVGNLMLRLEMEDVEMKTIEDTEDEAFEEIEPNLLSEEKEGLNKKKKVREKVMMTVIELSDIALPTDSVVTKNEQNKNEMKEKENSMCNLNGGSPHNRMMELSVDEMREENVNESSEENEHNKEGKEIIKENINDSSEEDACYEEGKEIMKENVHNKEGKEIMKENVNESLEEDVCYGEGKEIKENANESLKENAHNKVGKEIMKENVSRESCQNRIGFKDPMKASTDIKLSTKNADEQYGEEALNACTDKEIEENNKLVCEALLQLSGQFQMNDEVKPEKKMEVLPETDFTSHKHEANESGLHKACGYKTSYKESVSEDSASETSPKNTQNKSPQLPEETTNLHCPLCNYQSFFSSHMRHHLREHSTAKLYECTTCKYETNSRTEYQIHLLTHNPVKRFKCQICSYSTDQKANLLAHEMNHKGQKVYRCWKCEYYSNRKCDLKTHIFSHSQIKYLKCNKCEYATHFKSKLKNHVKFRHSRDYTGK